MDQLIRTMMSNYIEFCGCEICIFHNSDLKIFRYNNYCCFINRLRNINEISTMLKSITKNQWYQEVTKYHIKSSFSYGIEHKQHKTILSEHTFVATCVYGFFQ